MDILSKNLLILASAGSGKTFQLGNRVIGLVARGVAPERIVALTFTRKAAGEFADSVLTNLAEAAGNETAATSLRKAIANPDADFKESLERVVKALPRLTLGTMDGFFAKIVRAFQYELGLTGGRFDLLEGPRAVALADDMLAAILGETMAHGQDGGFFHAFRRATIGREDQAVLSALRGFVSNWQGIYQEFGGLRWGPEFLADVHPDEWAKRKSGLAAEAVAGLSETRFTDKRQEEALHAAVETLANHVIGGGSLSGTVPSLLKSILLAVSTQSGPLVVKSYKDFTIAGPACAALRAMVELAARCEMSAALLRTRAVREVVAAYDDLCAKQLRKKGLLGFNDVKTLMGAWAACEDARLRREAVDFRLDARTDHWLLDEFQDTSRADWNGLLPLIDEAVSGDASTMFIVGDRKQAIYGWRGGDVRLFDEVRSRYQAGLQIAPMTESWRSCPEVLALVNQVCGDVATLRELFGEVAARWEWLDHVPAQRLARQDMCGQARVEIVGDWEERLRRLPEILHELGVGKRAMTCGILLRGNDKAREVADSLRAQGFDVIEEGRREPAKDNPVGIVMLHLLKWLADPADNFAREVVEMSPLAGVLQAMHGTSRHRTWESLTESLSQCGFAETLGVIVGAVWEQWSDFGRRRAGDLLETLAALDARGGVSPKEAADWVGRLEVSQNPGVAAVQVMTIHKAKGLGFDLVVLPDIPDDSIPRSNYFGVAQGDDWLTQPPPQWARAMIPEMREAEARWAAHQQYEAFCTLYVALTRAKRGLYVLLEASSKTSAPDKPSLTNWVLKSIGADAAEGVIYQNGTCGWSDNIAIPEAAEKPLIYQKTGAAIPRRARMQPTRRNHAGRPSAQAHMGMKFGAEVHALLEQVAWADESPPALPATDAARTVARLLGNPNLNGIFQRQGRAVELFREQPVDAVMDGNHLSGVIDRLHVHRDAAGKAVRVEVIDFKTDAVNDPNELVERHSGQMNAYRAAMEKIHPEAEITCAFLSVRHERVIHI